MTISIQSIDRRDFDQARRFAIHGMNLDWYATNKLELYLYSKYFWYLELTKATRVLGAYNGSKLLGVLMVDMKGRPKAYRSWFGSLFIRIAEFFIQAFYGRAAAPYEAANTELLDKLVARTQPDGELNFFAVDPDCKGQGVGTLLLQELERREPGKFIYLFTDSGSTYQFYEHRGFVTVACKEITLDIKGQRRPLSCFLFGKFLRPLYLRNDVKNVSSDMCDGNA